MHKMIVEARINECAMRDDNPHVPWTVDEIVESAVRGCGRIIATPAEVREMLDLPR